MVQLGCHAVKCLGDTFFINSFLVHMAHVSCSLQLLGIRYQTPVEAALLPLLHSAAYEAENLRFRDVGGPKLLNHHLHLYQL